MALDKLTALRVRTASPGKDPMPVHVQQLHPGPGPLGEYKGLALGRHRPSTACACNSKRSIPQRRSVGMVTSHQASAFSTRPARAADWPARLDRRQAPTRSPRLGNRTCVIGACVALPHESAAWLARLLRNPGPACAVSNRRLRRRRTTAMQRSRLIPRRVRIAGGVIGRWKWKSVGSGRRTSRCMAPGRSGSNCCGKVGRWRVSRWNG